MKAKQNQEIPAPHSQVVAADRKSALTAHSRIAIPLAAYAGGRTHMAGEPFGPFRGTLNSVRSVPVRALVGHAKQIIEAAVPTMERGHLQSTKAH